MKIVFIRSGSHAHNCQHLILKDRMERKDLILMDMMQKMKIMVHLKRKVGQREISKRKSFPQNEAIRMFLWLQIIVSFNLNLFNIDDL